MTLGEPDRSGRPRPVPLPGSEFRIQADAVVVAIGSGVNPLLARTTPGLDTDVRGHIVCDPHSGQTSRPGVYAGGDITTGSATVILAMGAGLRAARSMHKHMTSRAAGTADAGM